MILWLPRIDCNAAITFSLVTPRFFSISPTGESPSSRIARIRCSALIYLVLERPCDLLAGV